MILGDYHTHTVFSHGKGAIEDNVKAALKKGLKEIAITDHGLRHIAFGMSRRDIPKMRKIIDGLNVKYPDIKILFGIEANIYCKEGLIDIKNEYLGYFDFVAAGFHKAVWPKSIGQAFGFFLRAYKYRLFRPGRSDTEYYTKVYIKAIKSGKIHMLTHLNYGVPVDVKEVGKAANDYGVFIELNGKKVSLADDEIKTLCDSGANFIMNSDAHSPERVGDFSVPLAVAGRLGIDNNKIANWGKLPVFENPRHNRTEL